MTDETYIPGGFVHDLPGDLEDALKLDPEARATWKDITPSGAERMDLLDLIRKKAGDEAQTDRVGSLEPEGWEAPSFLLGGMPSSWGRAKFVDRLCPLLTKRSHALDRKKKNL